MVLPPQQKSQLKYEYTAEMARSYQEVESLISEALEKYSELENPNVMQLAWEFDVLYTCLRSRIQGVGSWSEHPAVNKHLTDANEDAVREYIKCLGQLEVTVTHEQVQEAANHILLRHVGSKSFKSWGQHWLCWFLQWNQKWAAMMADSVSEPASKKKCLGADCGNDIRALQWSTCLNMSITDSYSCSQDCFKSNWICLCIHLPGTNRTSGWQISCAVGPTWDFAQNDARQGTRWYYPQNHLSRSWLWPGPHYQSLQSFSDIFLHHCYGMVP